MLLPKVSSLNFFVLVWYMYANFQPFLSNVEEIYGQKVIVPQDSDCSGLLESKIQYHSNLFIIQSIYLLKIDTLLHSVDGENLSKLYRASATSKEILLWSSSLSHSVVGLRCWSMDARQQNLCFHTWKSPKKSRHGCSFHTRLNNSQAHPIPF